MSEQGIISVVSVAMVFGAPLTWFIVQAMVSTWRQAKLDEQNAQLKREMIEREYSADDILRVLGGNASTPAATPVAVAEDTTTPLDPNAQFALEMIDRGCSINDVLRVLKAGVGGPIRGTPSQNAQFTLEMIDRGHSPDEVARVLEAGLAVPASVDAPAGVGK